VTLVRESHYQAHLEDIAGGKGADSCVLEESVRLVRESGNPYDKIIRVS
jgi:hypothetical protein